jgi:hypothetical protein
VLYQFPRNSGHVSRLPCEYVPIFLEEFDEHDFLFWVQIIAHVSNISVILRSKGTELQLPYVCPGTHNTCTMIHHGKTDAMFD